MGQRYPICSASDVIRVLRRNGFVQIGQKGSHQKWRHPDGRQVIVPAHGSKLIPIGTLKSIIEGSKLGIDGFARVLLKKPKGTHVINITRANHAASLSAFH